jgi:hypothetical protein
MKPGDLIQLATDCTCAGCERQICLRQNQVQALGIIIRSPKRGYDYIDWTYGGRWWWVMWGDGAHTMEYEKDIVVVS